PRARVSIVAEHVEFRPEFKKNESGNTERSVLAEAVPEAPSLAEQVFDEYAASEKLETVF
ncbi:MAG: single-stranded DNA-binding protein, partial [Treponema sp.]|nr:single-stranded DNA-binding protein [Treponema sp.]